MSKKLNTRAIAAKLSWQIIDKGQSLDVVLKHYFAEHQLIDQDRGMAQELVYGVCRWYGDLDEITRTLLDKPIRNKDRVIHFVLLIGLYQLRHINTAAHAAVAETVAACQQLNKGWAKNLVNGCLRSYLRNIDNSVLKPVQSTQIQLNRITHPAWMVDAIVNAWPEHIDAILNANNQRPPMCLRVNSRMNTRDQYVEALTKSEIKAKPDPYCRDGVVLEKPVAVTKLPNFNDGAVSVQDSAAQLCVDIIDLQVGQKVLDACAAPGGKTAHILERTDNNIVMHALDISARRCEQLHETLNRLKLNAKVFVGDASEAPSWQPPSNGYDRILIDAPCSGLGVIRRHPDIKHHRQPEDIDALNQTQQLLLDQLWKLLKPKGLLLYVTCSILPSENEQQIKLFTQTHKDAELADFKHPHALDLEYGKQTLPGVHDMDGFYYCLLRKK